MILDLNVTIPAILKFSGTTLFGYSEDKSLFPLFNKMGLKNNIVLYNCRYGYNKCNPGIIYISNYDINTISAKKNSLIYYTNKQRNPKLRFLKFEDEFFVYLLLEDNNIIVSEINEDIPYDFSRFPLFKIHNMEYQGKNYSVIREDLNPGGWWYRTIRELFEKKDYPILGIIYNGIKKYLIAEIYAAITLKKKLYIFSLIKSYSVIKILASFGFNSESNNILYYYIKDKPETNEIAGVIYSEHNVLKEIRKFIKDNNLTGIKLLYGIYLLEKHNILRNNIMHSIPFEMLKPNVRIWILYEPNNYVNEVFNYVYHKLTKYEVTILTIKISKSKFPAGITDKTHEKDGIFYVNDTVYSFSDLPDITNFNMNKKTEIKYLHVISKYGREGDYILNYLGDTITNINLIKSELLLMQI